MRQKQTRQMSLFSVTARHDIGQELKEISKVLDDTPQMLDLVYNDLIRNRRHETGREGMTAKQVPRSCVLKQFRCLSYEELAFHLEDSNSFRAFARLEMGQYPSSSTLQENIKPISEESWEAIHICLMRYAQRFGIENGREVRIDSTAVETDVHDPTDASLLWDGIRIITRYLEAGHTLDPRSARGGQCQKDADRVSAYRDMVHYACKVVGYTKDAIPALERYQAVDLGGI